MRHMQFLLKVITASPVATNQSCVCSKCFCPVFYFHTNFCVLRKCCCKVENVSTLTELSISYTDRLQSSILTCLFIEVH